MLNLFPLTPPKEGVVMLLNRQIKAVLIYRYNYVVFLLFLMTGLNRLLI